MFIKNRRNCIHPLRVGDVSKVNEWLSEAQWCEVAKPWSCKAIGYLSQGSGVYSDQLRVVVRGF